MVVLALAIKIKSPNTTLDNVPDPGNYFCRKGFFALNVQAICDSKKRILWMSTGHKGSTHDSLAFSETQLHALLERKKDYLYNHRLYIIGDSAYSLQSYMIVPYSNATPNTVDDSFNYWHSRTRIHIECAFGEIVMRWGVFWKKMNFKLVNNGPIINACCFLHNFFIDVRERCSSQEKEDEDFFRHFDMDGAEGSCLVTDNNEPNNGGRPTSDTRGNDIRDDIARNLYSHDMRRPLQNGMKYNRYGNVYMTY
jgi:hypothetical protein